MKALDLRGQKYGRLTVIEKAEPIRMNGSGKTKTRWLCQCDCGNKTIVITGSLRNGTTLSCGCFVKEKSRIIGSEKRIHGGSKTRLYSIWRGIKKRCLLPTDHAYKDYGGRGITICDEWKNDFSSFQKWALSNGYKDDLTIERIDVNGNYEASNCKWIPISEQAKNRRNSIRSYDEFGNEKNIRDIFDEKRLKYSTIEARVRKGWDVEQAIRIPTIKNEDRGKCVEQLSIDGKEVLCEYSSIVDASRQTGFSAQSIGYRCRRGGGEFGGYMWRFKKKLEIQIKYLSDIEPLEILSKGDLIDLRCSEDIVLKKGEYKLIPLGVAMKLPKGYFAEVFPRSSTFGKYKILMANSTGIVDHTYCGTTDMWYFPAYAVEDTKIEKNTRICQFMLVKQMPKIKFINAETLEIENRGGIGSTGEK